MYKLGMTAVTALSLLSGGCATLAPVPPQPSDPPARETSSSLRTMIVPTGGSYDEALAFQINRAGYAAVFRILPGQGAMMIYPRRGFGSPDGFLFSGFHRVVAARPGSSFVSALNAEALPTWRAGGVGAGHDPEYYFVIVSEQPLRPIGRLDGPGGWFQSNADGPGMMRWIVSQTVPSPGAVDWTTDYYVHWPETAAAAPGSGLVPLTCDGKRVWANPERYDRAVAVLCSEGQRPEEPTTRQRPNPGEPAPVDAGEQVEPQRRDPVPAAVPAGAQESERIGSRQLQQQEAGEQARIRQPERRRPVAADASPGADLSRPAATTEIERIVQEAERAATMRGGREPMFDSLGRRVSPDVPAVDNDPTRPGFDAPRVRPTFEVPPPAPPPPSLVESQGVEAVPPVPPPAPIPAQRSPSDDGAGEGLTRTRPSLE